jgi:hypothetical protein
MTLLSILALLSTLFIAPDSGVASSGTEVVSEIGYSDVVVISFPFKLGPLAEFSRSQRKFSVSLSSSEEIGLSPSSEILGFEVCCKSIYGSIKCLEEGKTGLVQKNIENNPNRGKWVYFPSPELIEEIQTDRLDVCYINCLFTKK